VIITTSQEITKSPNHQIPNDPAGRLLAFAGIALIAAGMLFGDIFAVFVLHQNAGRTGEQLLAATHAVAAGNRAAVLEHFARMGRLLENHGTKVDTHAHIIAFGYLALLLALLQPFAELSERRKKTLAWLFVFGAGALPLAVFLIYYVGLAFSPLGVFGIGWASMVADAAGLLVILATAGYLWGLRHAGSRVVTRDPRAAQGSAASRILLAGGTLLILAGFLHGSYYAAMKLYEHEEREKSLLNGMLDAAAGGDVPQADRQVERYGGLAAEKAVAVAAHSHIIEFGLLALLLSCVQNYVFLSERWKRRWAVVLLAGSVILPFFVQAELWWGLVAGGIADLGGLLLIIALLAMLAGILRYTGKEDAGTLLRQGSGGQAGAA